MSARTTLTAAAVISASFLAGALAGCQHQRGNAALAEMTGYELRLTDEADYAKLAYGQANSENIGLMLECGKGTGRIEVSDILRGEGRTLRLTSGEYETALMGEAQNYAGSALLIANAGTGAEAFDGFRESGRLTVETGEVAYTIAANDRERADVARFFTACGRA